MSLPAAGLQRCRVLLTDDDPLVRAVYADAMRAHGCEVTEARGGDEAVSLARSLLPDLVLMDLSMPGTDGWQALDALRGDARTRDLVVIALTASDSGHVRQRAAAAGFDGFVVKPFTAQSLLREVECAWTRAHAVGRSAPEPAQRPGVLASALQPT